MTQNVITGPWSAIIDGVSTGLAGCKNRERCSRKETCIRADDLLKSRAVLGDYKNPEKCNVFIPVGRHWNEI